MQLSFGFYDVLPRRPKRPERMFFGLFPDPETAGQLTRLTDRFVGEGHCRESLISPGRLHLSLHHVDDYGCLRNKDVYAATQAGNAVSTCPFEVTCRAVTRFNGRPSNNGNRRRRPLVLLCDGDGLFEIHRLLGIAMAKQGFRVADGFQPHITLAYGCGQTPIRAIDPIRFEVNEFFLIHSRLWLTQYHAKGRWPLRLH